MPLVSVDETVHLFMAQLYSFAFCSPTGNQGKPRGLYSSIFATRSLSSKPSGVLMVKSLMCLRVAAKWSASIRPIPDQSQVRAVAHSAEG